jgi:hypothetical protein
MKYELSSYQKMRLKYENKIQELNNDIIVLVEEKNIEEVAIVKMKHKIRLTLEKCIWSGN